MSVDLNFAMFSVIVGSIFVNITDDGTSGFYHIVTKVRVT